MSKLQASRDNILATMRSALAGSESPVTRGTIEQYDWLALDQNEKSALLQLHNWEQDRPLRSAFPRHAEYSNRRLEYLIGILA